MQPCDVDLARWPLKVTFRKWRRVAFRTLWHRIHIYGRHLRVYVLWVRRLDFFRIPQIIRSIAGSIPEIDEIFPSRPPPVKRLPPEEAQAKSIPIASGAGFFTPDAGNAGNLFRTWKPDISQPQPFRMAPPVPRDSL